MREVDLHGMKYASAMELFIEEHNAIADRGRAEPLKVIHGYGSSGAGGELRTAIRSLLKKNPASGEFVTGEVAEGNPGYTIVYPRRRLPEAKDRLWDAIIEFCRSPQTQSDILRKFVRRSGEPEVLRSLRELESRGRLRSFYKNGKKHFQTPLY